MSEPSLRKVDLCEADFLIASIGGFAERAASPESQHFLHAFRNGTEECLVDNPMKTRGFFEVFYLRNAIFPNSHCQATIREVSFDTKGEDKLSHEGPNGR